MTWMCDIEHSSSGARCFLDPADHGPMHQGWAHYPASLAVWPVADTMESTQTPGGPR